MTDRGDVFLDARIDRSLVWVAGASVRYVAVRLTGRIRGDETRPDRPHNLALAIDVSRQNGPETLDAAKAIARQLSGQDRLAIVAMDRRARTVLPSARMDDDGRRQALDALSGLESGSGLNLSDGWLAAAEAVAEQMDDDELHSRVVLLAAQSPGYGLTEAERLAAHARDLRRHLIFTTAAGIGQHANAALLAAVDDHLGRRVLVTHSAQDIADAVIHGSLEISPLVADDVTVRVTCRSAVEVEVLNPAAAHRVNGSTLRLDNLRAGEVVNVVFKLRFPEGSEDESVPVTIDASWCHPITGNEASAVVQLPVRFAHDRYNTHQPRDPAATGIAALAWHATIISRILELSRDHKHREASAYLKRELAYFQRYCEGLPMATMLGQSLRRALDAAYRPWRNRAQHEHPQGHGP
jgi:hypothetical protein